MKSPKAKAFDFAFHVSCFVQEEYQDQERFDRCAAEFISLMSVKETNQRKRFCAHGKPGQSLVKGFFEREYCPREKRPTSMCAALRVCGLNGDIEIGRAARREGVCSYIEISV